MLESRRVTGAFLSAMTVLLIMPPCGSAVRAQSIAPGTGRHSRRDRATVAKKRLERGAQLAESAQKGVGAALDSHDEVAISKALNRVQSADEYLRAGAAQAAMIDPDAAATIITSTVSAERAIGASPTRTAQATAALRSLPKAISSAREVEGIINAMSTDPTANLNWFLPTTLTKGWGFVGSDGAVTNAYFNAKGPLAFVTKVKYTYNPSTTINAISSDLIAMQFPYVGFQLALGGSGNNNPSSKTSTNPSSAAASTTPTSTSVQQAIQKLTQGGDFHLKWTLPVIYSPSSNAVQIQAFTTSTFGFELGGNNPQNTTSTASHSNENFIGEGYFQWDALPDSSSTANSTESLGSIYVDGRIGWQKVSSGEAANAGLDSRNSFHLGQVALGIVFNGFATLSAQRYWGPKQAYLNSTGAAVTVNNFAKWQVSVQFNPAVAAGKAN